MTSISDLEAESCLDVRGGPTNLGRFRGRDKWNSAGYAAAASG